MFPLVCQVGPAVRETRGWMEGAGGAAPVSFEPVSFEPGAAAVKP